MNDIFYSLMLRIFSTSLGVTRISLCSTLVYRSQFMVNLECCQDYLLIVPAFVALLVFRCKLITFLRKNKNPLTISQVGGTYC